MIVLSSDQENALDKIMNFISAPKSITEMAISGPAGSGKTFLTKYMLERIRKQLPLLTLLKNEDDQLSVYLTSTTNKATDVLGTATEEKACTIHSLLNLKVFNNYNTGETELKRKAGVETIENALIIIDEASMIDSKLRQAIQDYTKDCKIIYIGDAYQLAPVSEETSPVFYEVQNQVALTSIQRQVADNPIINFSQQFRSALDTGRFPILGSHGIQVQHVTKQEFQNLINNFFLQQNMHDTNSAKIITWTNALAIRYNNYVRKINGLTNQFNIGEIVSSNDPIQVNNKIVARTDSIHEITHIEPFTFTNNFDLSIGLQKPVAIPGHMIGLNNGIHAFQAEHQQDVKAYLDVFRKNKDWKNFFQQKEKFIDLRTAYACTTHKAQGSTYTNVFIDITDMGKNTKKSEVARLLYTAITRASDTVYMYGDLPNRVYL